LCAVDLAQLQKRERGAGIRRVLGGVFLIALYRFVVIPSLSGNARYFRKDEGFISMLERIVVQRFEVGGGKLEIARAFRGARRVEVYFGGGWYAFERREHFRIQFRRPRLIACASRTVGRASVRILTHRCGRIGILHHGRVVEFRFRALALLALHIAKADIGLVRGFTFRIRGNDLLERYFRALAFAQIILHCTNRDNRACFQVGWHVRR